MQQQTVATSASSRGAYSYENDILSDVERILNEQPATADLDRTAPKPRRFGLVASLILVAGFGAAFALVPADVKDALVTGRSVAHSSNR